MDIYDVILRKKILQSDLKKLPKHIIAKLTSWINAVGHDGLSEVRKVPGYHDEPLHGDRKGQRSIRLSKSYRAIYIINNSGQMEVVEIIEVNKHDY
ncbi:MAG: type II toxin-antitoxin system mRNA interferase toxin, RelE/StbE family [Tatlockia sp.]|nr:type II toxin-antitoxin system mRNA interferase toxin, RelE/StbE family [Tatlockia sp.]MBA3978637.1 type II toxin-antitoxin system mRNA interferase toxin, RelE/StbE family [Nitrosopumilus sp.]